MSNARRDRYMTAALAGIAGNEEYIRRLFTQGEKTLAQAIVDLAEAVMAESDRRYALRPREEFLDDLAKAAVESGAIR